MPLYRGSRRLILRRRIPVGAASIPLSLDGTSTPTNVTANTVTTGVLTTANINDILLCAIATNASPQNNAAVTGVTGGGLIWARVPGLTAPATSSTLDLWYAIATSTFSSAVTVNTVSSAFLTAVAFAVTGGKTSSPIDASGYTIGAAGTAATITTTATNTFSIGMDVNGGLTTTNGYTVINSTNFCCVSYKIVSAPLSGQVWTLDAPSGVSIGTAIQQGP